jgi:hypothetical protein
MRLDMKNYDSYSDSVQDPTTLEVIEKAVLQAVNWFGRRFAPGDLNRAELSQRGWEVALDAQSRHNPDKGPLGGFLYIAIRRQLGNYLTHSASPVTCSDLQEQRVFQAVSTKAISEIAIGRTPEQIAIAGQELLAAVGWLASFDAALEDFLVQYDVTQCEAFCRYYGLGDFAEQPPRKIATVMGLSVRAVYKMLYKMNADAAMHFPLYNSNRKLRKDIPNGIEKAIDFTGND